MPETLPQLDDATLRDRLEADPAAFIPWGIIANRLIPEVQPEAPDTLQGVALKVADGCNILCGKQRQPGEEMGYVCYMYHSGSQELQPDGKMLPLFVERPGGTGRFSLDLVPQLGKRIGEYCAATGQKSFDLLFHGGEPLHMRDPAAYYESFTETLSSAVAELSPAKLTYHMQTNGTLLTPQVTEMARQTNLRMSFSIDGDQEAHDRTRRTKHGKGTFELVDRNVRRFIETAPELFDGIIAVIDPRNNPAYVYNFLRAYNPPSLHFTLPYFNHDNPPPQFNDSLAPYGEWLTTVFHLWHRENGPHKPRIPFFDSIINMSRGGLPFSEAIGPLTSRLAFVRSDGQLEGLDALNIISPDQVATGMDIEHNSLEEYAGFQRARQQLGRKALADECKPCPIAKLCWGGHYESRYSQVNGHNNRSVFCPDLKKIIPEIAGTVTAKTYKDAARQMVQRLAPASAPIPEAFQPYRKPPSTPRLVMPSQIRLAKSGDAPALAQLQREAYMKEYADVLGRLGLPPGELVEWLDEDLVPRKLAEWEEKATQGNVIIATLGGNAILGFASLLPDEQDATLDGVYATPQLRDSRDITKILLREIDYGAGSRKIKTTEVVGSKLLSWLTYSGGFRQLPDATVPSPVVADHRLPLVSLVRADDSSPLEYDSF